MNEKKIRIKSAINKFFEELSRKKTKHSKSKNQKEPDISFRVRSGNLSIPGETRTPTAEQMITSHGYRSESHTVITADGYMITMHRVLPSYEVIRPRVVILHHGLFGSSDDWLLLGEQKALPYVLTDNGYDVWLLNARGNKYSKMHTRTGPVMMDFWDFSWHEIGVYDLPATITYISEITRQAELNFIGHSMGATALLVLLSTLPEYNYVLRSGILLSPLVFMYHAKGPLRMLANFYRTNGHSSLNFLGQTEFMYSEFPEQIIEKYCKGNRKTSCQNPLLLLGNGGQECTDPVLMSRILAHVPAGGSVKTLMHYVQLAKSGYFQKFDYEASNNLKIYKNVTPPLYNFRSMTLPMAMFSSPSDWLATVADIQTLLPLLQEVSIHHVVKAENFGHFDFVWSPDAPELVFHFILSILDNTIPKRDAYAET
uniref:Lipase n=1 Tax=Heliothis virescens TaxID=7102 RepID=A0A2A4JQS0_HELVI